LIKGPSFFAIRVAVMIAVHLIVKLLSKTMNAVDHTQFDMLLPLCIKRNHVVGGGQMLKGVEAFLKLFVGEVRHVKESVKPISHSHVLKYLVFMHLYDFCENGL
jgi:hypothetical protein